METEESFFQRALARIDAFMLALLAAGALCAFLLRGWRGGLGFLAGGAASVLSYRWIKQAVGALAPGAPPPRRRLVAFVALRYLLFGAAGYAILKFVEISLPAALAGLLVAAAAVLIEILYELIYVRT